MPVVNGAMLALVAAWLPAFALDGLGAAVLGSIVVTITGWFASAFIGPNGRVDLFVSRRKG